MLRNILHSVEQQMSAQLSEIRAKFTQSGDKGTSIEDVFRTFLRQYLPRRLAIGHGEIIDRNSSRSGQTDVVVVNDDHPFTFTPDKPGIFFIEGVSAVGEVKTVLNSTHLNSIIAAPGGHFKFPHLWPGQIPPGGTTRMDGLLLGMVTLCKAAGGFFEPIAFAAEFDEDTAVQEAVQNGGGQRGIAEEFVPVIHDSI